MIIPDINLLVYAYNDGAPHHAEAKAWWEGLVNGDGRIGIPWVVSTGFVRLMTHPKVLISPLSPAKAVDLVGEWFQYPHILPMNPGVDHLVHFRHLLEVTGVGANLVTDAHLASLALEYQAEVHSNDLDFSRFPGLRWINPL